ncbi:T9SS type A sorting domain-containing protein [Hymenobacter metallilatus]|uniref:T9SS C-terminal target domain-containing protein n=1 Tax=Hymenobacter metallilatus TaxID=2493666 RepID=A0A428JTM1_9BACT|nr:T9SS type A sorting domain-containing protein [Hymenobacter metallilatus]RSK37361.1 T9SS C-terminal target domain-containing protein [Hymenobacter metallilatus]
MKQYYILLVGLIGLICPRLASAQINLASVNPYVEDFNSLNGKTTFVSNSTIGGVYIEYGPYQSLPCTGNDGSNTAANFYHFGDDGASDRALGGVASFAITGTGYVAIRFKNTTGTVIKNLGISFAIEQWYNSGRQDQAQVSFDYRTSATAITSVGSGVWTNVSALNVDAPSTATVIDNKNGNSSANRRTRTYTIQDINLANTAEIMLRWRYELNNATNGNGLSVDDVTVTPETDVYYYKGTGNLNSLASWAPNKNGSGASPANFTTAGRTYYILSAITDDRVAANWTVSGANSKIVVGDGSAAAYLLILNGGGNGITGTVDVLDNATLDIQRGGGQLPTLGRIANKSTVKYVRDGSNTPLTSQNYGNLLLDGTSQKLLTGSTIINGDLTLSGTSYLTLGDYDLTIIRGGKITGGDNNAFIRTNGVGMLKQTVQADGVAVKYPVGTGTTYTPAFLTQTAARSEDVFSVHVKNGMYATYTGRNGNGTAISNRNVRRTWFVEEEVEGNSSATLQLQWPAAEHTSNFVPANARLEHYNPTTNKWDYGTAVTGASSLDGGSTYTASRSGITSFSPFSVSSRASGPLPVQLIQFSAQRGKTGVVATWETAQEVNNHHFVVERSTTGQEFEAIGAVAGQGSSSTTHRYQFVDAHAPATIVYYRLRQVDTTGDEAFSSVVAVEDAVGVTLAWVQPNPGTGLFQLVVPGSGGPVQAEVFSLIGAHVQTVSPEGYIDMQQQPNGMYLVRYRTAQSTKTLRLIKE